MLEEFIKEKSEYASIKNNLQKQLDDFDIAELKQKEDFLLKTETNKSDAEAKIQKLEEEISEIKNSLPQTLMDIEIRLRRISATKYHVIE